MLFKAQGKRLVYRVTSTADDGETCLMAFFHDPNAAQSHMAAQMLRPEFDGWKVVG